jgi:hypothetical protein
VECPTGSGNLLTLWEISQEISRRLAGTFLRDQNGFRAVHGASDKFQCDPHWKDLILFYEYFHGDSGHGVGASHQTGWTGVVAKLLQQSGKRMPVGPMKTKSRLTPGAYNIVDNDPAALAIWLPAFADFIGAPPAPHISDRAAIQAVGPDVVYYATQLRGASNEKAKTEFGFAPRPLEWLKVIDRRSCA